MRREPEGSGAGVVAMASRRQQPRQPRPLIMVLVGAVLLAFTGMECAAAAAGTDGRNSRHVAALGGSAAVARRELQQGHPGGDTHAERRQRLRDRLKSKATQHHHAPAPPKLVPAKSAEKPTSFQEAPSSQEAAAAAAAAAGSGSSTTPSKAAPAKARRSGGEMFTGSKRGARMMFPHIEGAVTDDKKAWETGKRSRMSPPPPREVDDYVDDRRKKGRAQEAGRGLHSFTAELNLSNSRTHS